MADPHLDEATGTRTVGHEWDGIEELDTPMPRWWLWTFYLTIVFAIGYVIVYPAIPLLNKGTEGLLGWTSRGQLAEEMSAADMARQSIREQIVAIDIQKLQGSPDLMREAVAGGRAAFQVNCVQCHGAGAAGSPPGTFGGYPNLADDDWLWGGSLPEIEYTIRHGIRQPDHPETRTSLMPSFGRDGILKPDQVRDVVSFVLTLSGKDRPDEASRRGSEIFAANCVVCHGPAGKGDRRFGAPDLTDAIWLFGGSREAVVSSVTNAHAGVMPAWRDKLDSATIRMLAAYVHSLGGGEDFVPSPAPEASVAAQPDAQP